MEKENSNNNKENEIKSKKAEEKQRQKEEKKLNKKVAKAVGIILFHEDKKSEEIFTDEPTTNMFFYHFGNGDEEDQIKTKQYFVENYGSDVNVIIYPGISYGFIELKSMETANKIIRNQKDFHLGKNAQNFDGLNEQEINDIKNENLKKFVQKKKDENNPNNNNDNKKVDRSKKGNPHSSTKMKIFYHNLNFENGERTIFTIFSKITSQEVKQKELCNVPNSSLNTEIKGLLLINDFISEEEEKKLLEEINKNKWEKLSNRKVQHYGYEFIYGVNIINKNKKIGELPEFCDNLKLSNF